MPEQCAFCQILKDDATKRVTLENDLAIVIRDRFPISPGHSLIIPKRHLRSFFETSREEQFALLELIEQTKSQLDDEFSPNAYNVGINDGPAAGQTINHLHIHLIPRYHGDTHDPRGGVRWLIPERADYWSKKE